MRAKLTDLLARIRSNAWRQWLAARRHRVLIGAIVLVALLLYIATAVYGNAPLRKAGPVVSLDGAGYPGVSLKIVHPTFIGPDSVSMQAKPITIMTRADSLAAVDAVTLIVAPPDDTLTLVDGSGTHISGRVTIEPGFPEWRPYDLWVANGNTQATSGLLGQRRVELTPAVMTINGVVTLPEASFTIIVDGPLAQTARRAARVWSLVFPLLVILAALTIWLAERWKRRSHSLRLEQERLLAGRYAQLRSHIKLEQWDAARHEIEAIQSVQPEYRDITRLEALVSTAETATWRREQLYATGLAAYRQRQWPAAAQAFAAVEQENPYYREAAFLKRTSELYADLASRDRSVRVSAAQELGRVGDLVDMAPLVVALGDKNEEVAQAAEQAFMQIGPRAADDLIGALKHSDPVVRRRAYGLLEQMGQDIHERLLAGLHSSDPTVTHSVARLLARLGARDELAHSLLWIEAKHHEGIGRALASEHVGAVQPLVQVLYEAPPERRQGIINVLSSLLEDEDVRIRTEELFRATKDQKQRALLQRVIRMADQAPAEPATPAMAVEEQAGQNPPNSPMRWLRRLDKGQ